MSNSPIVTTSFFERIIFSVLNFAFKRKDILSCEKQIYLRRWIVFRLPFFGLFVHKFERSDEDRGLHDHPWSFIIIPIWRGYIEHSFDFNGNYSFPELQRCKWLPTKQRRVLPILGTRFRKARYAHRVELLPRQLSEHDKFILIAQANRLGKPYVPQLDKPAWSLFFVFRRKRKWGFFLPTGWKTTEDYHKEFCE